LKNMFQRVPVDQSPVGEPERRGDERSEAARSGGSSTGDAADPDPEVPAKPQRRRFSAEYRLRILKQADACRKPGELGALLRREGLYSSLLTNWRRQRDHGALREMRGRRRGPKARPVDPRVKQLEAENRRLQRKLQRAETIITHQKKVAEILGIPLKPLDSDESD
jgi:transposase